MGRGKRAKANAVRSPREQTLPRHRKLTPEILLRVAGDVVQALNARPSRQPVTKTFITEVENRIHALIDVHCGGDRGNAALGPDIPRLGYDIKVTSMCEPQSSATYRHPAERVFGLQYGILLLPYEKHAGRLAFAAPVLIPQEETGDRRLTAQLIEMKDGGATAGEIVAFLRGAEPLLDKSELNEIAFRILREHLTQGRLGISAARQWRVRYREAIREARKDEGQKVPLTAAAA